MIAALSLALALAQASPVPAGCDYDRAAMLAMTPQAFDQDPAAGWRPLGERPGCRGAAADLLALYRAAHRGEMTAEELHVSYWHEGQVRAGLGETTQATRLLMAGVDPAREADGFEEYALGTIAFLRRDREGLKAARDRLAALPPIESWAKTQADFKSQFGVTITWPMNLDVLDGLLACFDRPYSEAYGAPCRS